MINQRYFNKISLINHKITISNNNSNMLAMSIFTFQNKIKYQYEDIKSNKLILHHHLGLGDHLTCNGLVNYLSEIFNEIYLPVFEKTQYRKFSL